ncbi:hypothetical protein M902_2574 [Bacteriovorax sp. BAL6_X]|uniref:hypothetical protein n=1 Tax=Bacteriovorax sp. BAL6_X TaxID=1201290 RepID=UPI000386CBAC|nr:hypothetical protein [Bacteriovorax sp. BAL6_X]EPZ50969.1 hypothetical protein M902_2574 [Bacteriovorax sp. BAL6_X]
MKSVLFTLAMLFAVTSNAKASSNIREICENAYYATGYTKLHQYNLIVNWARISDHALVDLENIIYSDYFKVLAEKDLGNNKSKYTLKENGKLNSYQYEAALSELEKITGNSASCVYDL